MKLSRIMIGSVVVMLYVVMSWIWMFNGSSEPVDPWTWWHPAIGVFLLAGAVLVDSVWAAVAIGRDSLERKRLGLTLDEQDLLKRYREGKADLG